MPYAFSNHIKNLLIGLSDIAGRSVGHKAGQRVVRGLVNRRADEVRLCLRGASEDQ